MNKVWLLGRWTRDPELRYSNEGIAWATCDIAVRRGRGKNGEDAGTDFFRVVMFRNVAETVAEYTRKGSLVHVFGQLRTRRYAGKDGAQRSVTEIRADIVTVWPQGRNGGPARARENDPGLDPPDLLPDVDLGEFLDDGPLG